MKHLYIALLGLGAAVTVQGQRIVDRHAFAQRPTGLTAAEVGTRDASGVGSLELVQRGLLVGLEGEGGHVYVA